MKRFMRQLRNDPHPLRTSDSRQLCTQVQAVPPMCELILTGGIHEFQRVLVDMEQTLQLDFRAWGVGMPQPHNSGVET